MKTVYSRDGNARVVTIAATQVRENGYITPIKSVSGYGKPVENDNHGKGDLKLGRDFSRFY